MTAPSSPRETPPTEAVPTTQPPFPVTPPTELEVTGTHRIKRLGWHLLADATLSFVAAEKGFLYTMRSFLREPRSAFESYLGAERLRFSNPLKLVIFLAAIATFLNYQFGSYMDISQGFANRVAEQGDDAARAAAQMAAIDQFFRQNYNLMLLASLPVMALVSRLFYWRRAYNWMEHLALNSFVFAVYTVAYLLQMGLFVLYPWFGLVYMLAGSLYQTWVFRRVLGPGWLRAFLATTVSYTAYMVVFIGVLGAWLILKTR